jgi:hypothetical protein
MDFLVGTGGPQCVVAGMPEGVPFSVTLHCSGKTSSQLLVSRAVPDDLEALRLQRLREALGRKCPKLSVHKADGRETVLVLESNDIALGNNSVIAKAFVQALGERTDPPDRVFLVETEGRPWYLWTLKEVEDVYPSPRLQQIGSVKI